MSAVEALLAPFRFDFMNQAFLITTLVAVPAALLSCFLVLKGWALLGDAVSHAVFPGVVLAYLAGWPLAVGAFLAGMVAAVGSGYLGANSRIKHDTALGIVFSGMFGLGLVMYVKIETNVHLNHVLFGNMLGVGRADVVQTAVIALVVTAALTFRWRDFLLHAFDPVQARAAGLPVGALHYGLLALIALTVVAALQAVGVILVVAVLIAPGATAYLLSRVAFRDETGTEVTDAVDRAALRRLIEAGYVALDAAALCATPAGRQRLDAVLAALLA